MVLFPSQAIFLRLASCRVDLTGLHETEECHHVRLGLFCVCQNVATLLRKYSRCAIQQIALKSQSERSARLNDCLTSFGHIDLLDSFASDLTIGPFSDGSNEPLYMRTVSIT